MIARIAPLLRLPRSIGVFDYRQPENLALNAGSLVRISFRRRLVTGLVLGTTPTSKLPGSRILNVEKVISTAPILPLPQLEAALKVAADGFTSIATTLRSILPHFKLTETFDLPPIPNQLPDRQLRAVLDRDSADHSALSVVSYLRDRTKYEWYRTLGSIIAKAESSAVFVTPTINRAERLCRQIPNSILFHHGLGVNNFRSAFMNIRHQKSAIVVGARSAIFAPLQNIGLILIDDEDADEHVQEQPSPRYDDRIVAELLGKTCHAKVILASRLPSLAISQRQPVSRRLDQDRPLPAFIDLDAARQAGNYQIISDTARDQIAKVMNAGEKVVLVHHRRSLYGSLECQDCGFVPTCPVCQTPFADEGAVLRCRHCGTESATPKTCPRCRGTRLKGRGRGIPHVQTELAAIPGCHQDKSAANASVISEREVNELAADTFTLALITRVDSLLTFPRPDAEEQARRTMLALLGKVRSGGTIMVQGTTNQRRFCTEIYDDAWRIQALTIRERFGYPPAWRVLLLRRRINARSDGTSLDDLIGKLRGLDGLTVVGPYPSRGRSSLDRGGMAVLLRYRTTLPDAARVLLHRLDEGWTITPDPVESV